MTTFQWTTEFETGLETVDEQHHRLVDVINRYGDQVAEGHLDSGMLAPLLKELLDYTRYHFNEEEKLMEDRGLDPRHTDSHRQEHADFIAEVSNLRSGMSFVRSEDLQHLYDFLIHWLAFHILGADQNMARQIHSCSRGISPPEAYIRQEVETRESTAPMLTALNNLFTLVSSRNRDLVRLNESLEQKVKERTSNLEQANRQLEMMALTDVLTGLRNRRYALKALESLWEESRGTPLACMMIDADDFKPVNDTYGHDAGDRVLIRLAETLQDHLRTDDILCRMGGDEFLVICPATDAAGVNHVAESLLREVNRLTVDLGNGHWRGRVSIGVAVQSPGMTGWNDLIKSADNAVYRAKETGRNRVCMDPESPWTGQS